MSGERRNVGRNDISLPSYNVEPLPGVMLLFLKSFATPVWPGPGLYLN